MAFAHIGCGSPEHCANLFDTPPISCLLETHPPPEKRQRSRPEAIGLWLPQLSPEPILHARWAPLIAKLNIPGCRQSAQLRKDIRYIALLYRSRLVQRALQASRADNRSANIRVARLATKLATWLDGRHANRIDWDKVPLLRPPESGHPSVWLDDMVHALGFLLNQVVADPKVRPESVQNTIATLVDILRISSRTASTSLWHWAIKAQADAKENPDLKPLSAMKAGLLALHLGAQESAEIARRKRGPDINFELMLAIRDLDKAVHRARKHWLNETTGNTRGYTGTPKTSDEAFLVGFCTSVIATIPPCIQAREPYLFRPLAALDALKEHTEARNVEEYSPNKAPKKKRRIHPACKN